MRRTWRTGTVVAATAVGLVVGAAAGFLAQGEPLASLPPETAGTPPPAPRTHPLVPDTVLAWTPGGLPPGFAAKVERLPAVRHSVAVVSGILWMNRSVAADGTTVDRPADGLAVPIEVAGANLDRYAPFLSPADRVHLPDLAGGQGLLGRTSETLRRVDAGGSLTFRGSRTIRVAGVVPDAAIGANELFVSGRTAASLGLATRRYLLIDPAHGVSRARLDAAIRGALPSAMPLRIRGPGETPYFRQGDAVLPQVRLKELFGEFAAAPVGGYLRMDPRWEAAHIGTARVPLLGAVRCNRGILPQLRGALREVESEGLGHTVDPAEFGGCYSPRFLLRDPHAGLSHHAWGIAVDINVAANPFGRAPTQDHRLVAIFERWGFTWGGRFLIPDGMHFEFARFASGG
jgi:hypothetical protein